MDVETAHRYREGGGEEGVLATLAFLVIAIGAAVGVEVDTDVLGVSVPGSNSADHITRGGQRDMILGAREAILEVQVSNKGEHLA